MKKILEQETKHAVGIGKLKTQHTYSKNVVCDVYTEIFIYKRKKLPEVCR